MNHKLEQFFGPAFTDQMVKYLKEVPSETAELIKLIQATQVDQWEGYHFEPSNKVFQNEVWIGDRKDLIMRLDLSFRRLAPLVPDKQKPGHLKVGPIDATLPFNHVAARLLLLPCPVDALGLDFGTLQQYQPSEQRAWLASFTYHQGGFKTISIAVKNLNKAEGLGDNTLFLDSLKEALPQNPNGTNPEWITMNGYNGSPNPKRT